MVLMILGFCSGVLSGMGIGGGTLLIPVLVLFWHLDQQAAQGVNLLYFVPTALMALRTHQKAGNLEKNVLKPLVLGGFLAAAAGAMLAVSLDAFWLRRAFGVFLLGMGILEICKKK